jgi:cytidine deaminase
MHPDAWARLCGEASRVAASAYAPYSKFRVGAAAYVDDGRIVTGCNVENASYGLGLCAECGLVSALHASGGGRLVAFACVDGTGDLLAPCGRCRQLLYEHGGPELLVKLGDGVTLGDGVHLLGDLLPAAFDPDELPGASPREGRAR